MQLKMTNLNQLPGFYAWPVSRENLTTLPNIQELCSYYLFGKSATFHGPHRLMFHHESDIYT